MPEPSSNPHPIGSRPENNGSQFIVGCPLWWNPKTSPEQILKAKDKLTGTLGFEAWEKNPMIGLLLYGPPGVGKTSAGLAVLYEWGMLGKYARFQDFQELMVTIRSSWRKDAAETVDDIHAKMYKPAILLIDDVGKRAAPEDQETISTLVNGRWNRGKPTILTTNCELDKEEGRRQFFAACDSRVLERYSGYDVDASKWGINLRRKT